MAVKANKIPKRGNMKNLNDSFIKLGWVRTKILVQLKGHTEDALKKDKSQGLFIEGEHWTKDFKGRVWWNYEAIDELIMEGFSFSA